MASDTLLRIAIFMFPQKTMTLCSLWPLPDPLTIHSLGPQPYCKWQPWDRQSTHSWSFPGWSDSTSMHQCSVLSVLPCSLVPMVTLDLKSSLDGKYAVHNIAYYITSHHIRPFPFGPSTLHSLSTLHYLNRSTKSNWTFPLGDFHAFVPTIVRLFCLMPSFPRFVHDLLWKLSGLVSNKIIPDGVLNRRNGDRFWHWRHNCLSETHYANKAPVSPDHSNRSWQGHFNTQSEFGYLSNSHGSPGWRSYCNLPSLLPFPNYHPLCQSFHPSP